MDHLQKTRQAVRAVLQHVNTHGGWTYVGWLRTGTVQDSSDTLNSSNQAGENLASATQQPHLSYLYPTNPECIAENNDAFQACRLNNFTTTRESHQEQQQEPTERIATESEQEQPILIYQTKTISIYKLLLL
jgi:hypothetical protein